MEQYKPCRFAAFLLLVSFILAYTACNTDYLGTYINEPPTAQFELTPEYGTTSSTARDAAAGLTLHPLRCSRFL